MRNPLLVGLITLPLLFGVARAEEFSTRDLTLDQTSVATFTLPTKGDFRVSIASDRDDGTYAIGETARLFITTNEDAFVTVFSVGPTGQVAQLFPSRFQPDNRVRANQPVEIAGERVGAQIRIRGPVGRELLKVIATNKPMKIITSGRMQDTGPFQVLDGGAEQLVRNLSLVPNAGGSGMMMAVANFALRTIPSRQQTIVIGNGDNVAQIGGGGAPVLPVVVPGGNSGGGVNSGLMPLPVTPAFPLLVAVDRPFYKIGETVTLAVTSMKACNLTVLEFAPSGATRVLFPNKVTPMNAIGAGQTLLISGGPSPVALKATGPTGVEQILAICTPDNAPILKFDGEDLFRSAGERDGVARDLALLANRPAGGMSAGSATFVVER
jgi:hypothetical protein